METMLLSEDFWKRRPLPRPFLFPWGHGQIVEEVSFRGKHHEPTVQLLEFTDGFELVRFCSYTLSGRFERNSWIASTPELDGLRAELSRAPRLKALLRKLIP
jgi:hypothetical protein